MTSCSMNETIVQLNFQTAERKEGHSDTDRDCVSKGVTAGCLWITRHLPYFNLLLMHTHEGGQSVQQR
jgi:hypothetical protein